MKIRRNFCILAGVVLLILAAIVDDVKHKYSIWRHKFVWAKKSGDVTIDSKGNEWVNMGPAKHRRIG